MQTCVIFATANRPQIVAKVLRSLNSQLVKPASVILSCVDDADADISVFNGDVKKIIGEAGLTKQRNRALRNLPKSTSVVVFFDDDFVPHPRWIEVVEQTFEQHPDVVAITGNLIADGINGPGYTFEQSQELINRFGISKLDWLEEPFSPYGCNMAYRRSALEGVWFDEKLVLYGWQEDRDFGAQVARRGRSIKVGAALGVHMGVKSGRVSGLRLGYSQVVNPIYLYRKGTMAAGTAISHVCRNLASNLAKSFAPEPYVDRFGRLRGNLLALLDVCRGRISPERASLL
jgi:glycosyltransferase involved in cell wall biosynthesis